MKDTSGPSINILIKLMAITSLVFGNTFVKIWQFFFTFDIVIFTAVKNFL